MILQSIQDLTIEQQKHPKYQQKLAGGLGKLHNQCIKSSMSKPEGRMKAGKAHLHQRNCQ